MAFPAQHQERQPGIEAEMQPKPRYRHPDHKPCGTLQNRVVLITGGDSGIGRASAVAAALEGAKIAFTYLDEEQDAAETRALVEQAGQECTSFSGDIGDRAFCEKVISETVGRFGSLYGLFNNAGEQHPEQQFEDLDFSNLEKTFRTNILSQFYLTRPALKHLEQTHGAIVNNASVNAYRGSPQLVDYSATKGAIVSFTRSLSLAVVEKGIRVNAVAPGPVWTPLQISGGQQQEKLPKFGAKTSLGRAGQPVELAPLYVQLASQESSFATGQVHGASGGGGMP